ncbi:hypothetical protein ANCCAN_17373 [Ancylostoma caninum]|uniref:3-hydroxyacyl-CoA dehydrogenase NAD binding domain-containing protein n=1 Tax=Ancylostoma caninum TaxID=29170 RepID=A0A368FZ37_ANCCA|nr:hypothetical protein ANCCAN_17373 [Ancylostoma caninum]
MASAIVVGEGKLAAVMTKMLCSCGTPVALYGAEKLTRETVKSMLQEHIEESFPLQFIDDLRHQQEMLSRLLGNLRMTDDVSRLFGEVIVDATQGHNTALLRAVRRFVPEAVVMSLDGAANDEKTVGVHVYEPFEITRIMQIVPSPATDSASVARVRSLLKNAHIVELDRKQGDLAERYVPSYTTCCQ